MPEPNQMYATPSIGVYSYYRDGAESGGWNGTYADCLQRCKDFGEECYGVHFSEPGYAYRICALLRDNGEGGEWGVFEDACDNCYYRDGGS